MDTDIRSHWESFARRFVREYWAVVKAGTFSMPPNEPVEESLPELLARVSYTTEYEGLAGQDDGLYKLRMADTLEGWGWWLFSFRHNGGRWKVVGCSARSDDEKRPHDLLGPVYAKWFEPFLAHVTERATRNEGI